MHDFSLAVMSVIINLRHRANIDTENSNIWQYWAMNICSADDTTTDGFMLKLCKTIIILTLHFDGLFQVTLVCLLKQKMMEVVVTTGAIGRAKLQSNHHHQQTNIQFFYRPDALPVAQQTVSKH